MFGRKSALDVDPPLRCSFCNKTRQEVRKLIAGPPPVFICDECVEVCNDIIADDNRFEAQAAAKNGRPRGEAAEDGTRSRPEAGVSLAGPTLRCALCRFPTPADDITWIRDRGGLCPGCVGEIEAAIAERRRAEE